MKKINWEPKGSNRSTYAQVGSIGMCCLPYSPRLGKKPQWSAEVWIIGGPKERNGPRRYSLQKAKDDAVRIACELLLDYQAGLEMEMANFDLGR